MLNLKYVVGGEGGVCVCLKSKGGEADITTKVISIDSTNSP